MIQLKITGIARRSSSQVGTRRFTYPEEGPRVAQQFHGAEWEEVEFQILEEEKPTIGVANIEGSAYLVNNLAKILLNEPALFGTFKVGDIINFVPVASEPVPAQEPTPVAATAPPVIETTAESIVVPKLF